MKIYLISHNEFSWDCYSGHVVVASSPKEVRKMAKDIHAKEGLNVWDTAKIEVCGEYTGKQKEPFIILSDFNAG